jgi:PAS domain S-box-containing protein
VVPTRFDNQRAFELMAEYTSDVVVRVMLDGTVGYISPAIRRYGYKPAEIVGTDGLHLIHPDDQAGFAANAAALLRGETDEAANRQHRMRRADGTWAWVEGNPRVVRDAAGKPLEFINVFRDVTCRREAEERAHERDELFAAAFESAAVGMALVALDGSFLRLNDAFCRLTGYSREAMLAMDFQAITHPDDLDTDLSQRAALADGRIDRYEVDKRYRRSDGSIVWAHLAVSIVRGADGAPRHYVAQAQDLSARKAAEDALVQSEARFRMLAENASDVIGRCGPDGTFTYVSPSSVQVYGYTPEELVGRSAAMLFHPDDLADLRARLAALFRGGAAGQQPRAEHRIVTKSGEIRWIEAAPFLVRDPQTGRIIEMQDAARDITQRKVLEEELEGRRAEAERAGAALQASEARYRLIAENSSDMIVISDFNGKVSYVSAASRRLGWEPDDLIGQTSAADGIHPDDIETVRVAFGKVRRGEPSQPVRWRGRSKGHDGWVWLESKPNLLRDPATGAPTAYLDVIRDVTEHVAQEDALAQARAEAEAAAAAKAQFLANMSHEIRTPLTAVLGFTGLLRDDPTVQGAAAGYVARIAGAGNGLLAIVNDVLDFSKLEAGKFEIRPQPTRLTEVCEETLLMFARHAEDKGLALTFEAAPGLPEVAMLDGDRLRQALVNLIGNAVKFTEAGGVAMRVQPAEAAGFVQIEVQDSGPGLDAEAQALLFQRFTQIDGSMTRRHGGTGLGLSISRGLAEAMGGSIAVTSAPGAGACFRLVLPAPPAVLAAELAGDASVTSVEGARVLVVEDNSANRELARRLLEAAGVEVSEACDGLQALERLALLPVDVVLMDLRMPVLDGRGALARLRAGDGPNTHVPVLAFTADADISGDEDLSGFDGLLRKPIEPMDMLRQIAAALAYDGYAPSAASA